MEESRIKEHLKKLKTIYWSQTTIQHTMHKTKYIFKDLIFFTVLKKITDHITVTENHGLTHDRDPIMAESVNEYFSNIGGRLANEIPRNNEKDYLQYPIAMLTMFQELLHSQVFRLIMCSVIDKRRV